MIITTRYELKDKLGEGGVGTVYRGLDRHTDQPIAIKHLKSADTTQIARFIREGEALRQLGRSKPCFSSLIRWASTPMIPIFKCCCAFVMCIMSHWRPTPQRRCV